MFFTGDLRAGISRALHEGKFVACFVTNEAAESKSWQNEYLADEQVRVALDTKAINLRIQSDSTEAHLLSAYHPVATTPCLLIIRLVFDRYV